MTISDLGLFLKRQIGSALSPTWHIDIDGLPLRLLPAQGVVVGAHVLPRVKACQVVERDCAVEDAVSLLQRRGQGLPVPLPDHLGLPRARQGGAAEEAEDDFGVAG